MNKKINASKSYNYIKTVEKETLKTFQEEMPSIYFSDKTEEDYFRYRNNAEYVYRYLFKFPPKMFEGVDLIDFGAGTGENTIYLADWGAFCTLVEMNHLAHKISKEVFQKYAKSFDKHRFICSSVFDYIDDKKYDIVHCRGVLSHTAAKEEAFQKIASFVKPGGYLIFGDPNKAGGFQNMLQRFAVYHFASTPDEMVQVCETLFKEDIDRSRSFIPRTRRAIIFDRWVIQSQDDPFIYEVVEWLKESGLCLYSCYPPILLPFLSDSIHYKPKIDPCSFNYLFSISELAWMLHTDSDACNLSVINDSLSKFSICFSELTSYLANFNSKSKLTFDQFTKLSNNLAMSTDSLDSVFFPIKEKLSVFLQEANKFVQLVLSSDIADVRTYLESTRYLFKGACGVRHVDFIMYKPDFNNI